MAEGRGGFVDQASSGWKAEPKGERRCRHRGRKSGGGWRRTGLNPKVEDLVRKQMMPERRATGRRMIGSLIPRPPMEIGNWALSHVESDMEPRPNMSHREARRIDCARRRET